MNRIKSLIRPKMSYSFGKAYIHLQVYENYYPTDRFLCVRVHQNYVYAKDLRRGDVLCLPYRDDGSFFETSLTGDEIITLTNEILEKMYRRSVERGHVMLPSGMEWLLAEDISFPCECEVIKSFLHLWRVKWIQLNHTFRMTEESIEKENRSAVEPSVLSRIMETFGGNSFTEFLREATTIWNIARNEMSYNVYCNTNVPKIRRDYMKRTLNFIALYGKADLEEATKLKWRFDWE